MAQQTDATHEKPTSEWDYCHALGEGDVLIDDRDDEWRVEKIAENGRLSVLHISDCRAEYWYPEEVATALAQEEIYRKSDGLSHHLAAF